MPQRRLQRRMAPRIMPTLSRKRERVFLVENVRQRQPLWHENYPLGEGEKDQLWATIAALINENFIKKYTGK